MNQPAYKQESQQDFTNMPVGEILRRTRLHYNRTIEEVEATLRIQSKQLEAIETGDTEALPARVYAIGFVRSYAEYLGLDGEKIVTLFKEQSGETKPKVKAKLAVQKDTSKKPPFAIIIGVVVFTCVVILAAITLMGDKQPIQKKPEMVPEVPQALKAKVLEEKQKSAVAKPTEPEVKPKAPKPKGIVLKMLSDSWVEIRDQNRRKLISRVLKKGDQYFVPERLDLTISIGNAGGVEIIVDGEPLDNLGVKGQVLRNIPLDAEALKARFPKALENSEENAVENTDENQ